MDKKKNDTSFHELVKKFNSYDNDALVRLVPSFEEKLNHPESSSDETVISSLIVVKSLVFGGAYLTGNRLLQKALSRFEFWKVEYSPSSECNDPFMTLCMAFSCLVDLGDYKSALSLLSKYSNKQIGTFIQSNYFKSLLAVIYIQAPIATPEQKELGRKYCFDLILDEKCFIRFREFLCITAENSIDDSLFPDDVKKVQEELVDKSDSQLKAEYLVYKSLKMKDENELLKAALEIKEKIREDHLVLKRRVFSIISKIDESYLNFKERIFLNFFFESPFSEISKELGQKREQIDGKIFVIENQNIKEINVDSYLKLIKKNTIDLVSGMIQHDGKKTLLSDKRYKLLKNAIFYSVSGVSEFTLTEKVFEDENLPFSSLLLRTRDLVTQLQRAKLPIVRENCRVKFDFDKVDVPIVISSSVDLTHGILWRLKLKYDYINRVCLKSELGVSQATANRLLKQWLEMGAIATVPGRYGDYTIVRIS